MYITRGQSHLLVQSIGEKKQSANFGSSGLVTSSLRRLENRRSGDGVAVATRGDATGDVVDVGLVVSWYYCEKKQVDILCDEFKVLFDVSECHKTMNVHIEKASTCFQTQ